MDDSLRAAIEEAGTAAGRAAEAAFMLQANCREAPDELSHSQATTFRGMLLDLEQAVVDAQRLLNVPGVLAELTRANDCRPVSLAGEKRRCFGEIAFYIASNCHVRAIVGLAGSLGDWPLKPESIRQRIQDASAEKIMERWETLRAMLDVPEVPLSELHAEQDGEYWRACGLGSSADSADGADGRADTTENNTKLPQSEDVRKLALELVRQLPAGEKNRNEIALEFTKGTSLKPDSLLRKLRSSPTLKSLVDRADPKKK